jgi:NAD(P)-dependent dehydrogenase (short-subunit alcohol dehydrogenase family)
MKHSDDLNVQGQVALVTGVAKGLGRACALALAEAGADIALGFRDVNADNGLVKEIEALGRKALPLQMDVSKMDEIHSAFDKIKEYYKRLDIVVNNAGVAPKT